MKKDLEYLAIAEYKSNELRIVRLHQLIKEHEQEMRELPIDMARFEVVYRESLLMRLTNHQDRRDVLYTEAGSLVHHLGRSRHWFNKFRDFVARVWNGLKQKVARFVGKIRRFFHRK